MRIGCANSRATPAPPNTPKLLALAAAIPLVVIYLSIGISCRRVQISKGIAILPRGSKPGERRGGRRKGSRNKATIERELLAQRVLQNAPAGAIQQAPLGKEVLEQYMVAFDALAQHYRPIPESPNSDEAKFTKFATATCDCARALAPYQSPTYRAVMLSSPRQEGNGAPALEMTREELARKLEERGLPPFVFGIDKPTLEIEPRRIEGNGSSEPED